MAVSEVKQLRPLGTRYDVINRGRVIKLVLDNCECGVHARWVIETPRNSHDQDSPWTKLQIMFSGRYSEDGETIQQTIRSWHWKPSPWQRFCGLKMEPQLMKWIEATREELLGVFEKEARLEKIRDSLIDYKPA